jgi:hypothetical protein
MPFGNSSGQQRVSQDYEDMFPFDSDTDYEEDSYASEESEWENDYVV